ncbi:MAG: hypothetical protein KKB81_05685 [Candidatus Margulisbacteria bacterium]|nr:hypothetical protein [Candidatus Margulisiibacteriota bacterium]MBU1021863.1 hypothetical protein [Candidatus Margulisiibacteriota bacterium]MBU1729022.1 hypothetical protein [Candidatus Margulisiibacteriota bacterium]MBU1954425.1 hypothetical protein [Candidatus Margulisiibacteriota bacterium]
MTKGFFSPRTSFKASLQKRAAHVMSHVFHGVFRQPSRYALAAVIGNVTPHLSEQQRGRLSVLLRDSELLQLRWRRLEPRFIQHYCFREIIREKHLREFFTAFNREFAGLHKIEFSKGNITVKRRILPSAPQPSSVEPVKKPVRSSAKEVLSTQLWQRMALQLPELMCLPRTPFWAERVISGAKMRATRRFRPYEVRDVVGSSVTYRPAAINTPGKEDFFINEQRSKGGWLCDVTLPEDRAGGFLKFAMMRREDMDLPPAERRAELEKSAFIDTRIFDLPLSVIRHREYIPGENQPGRLISPFGELREFSYKGTNLEILMGLSFSPLVGRIIYEAIGVQKVAGGGIVLYEPHPESGVIFGIPHVRMPFSPDSESALNAPGVALGHGEVKLVPMNVKWFTRIDQVNWAIGEVYNAATRIQAPIKNDGGRTWCLPSQFMMDVMPEEIRSRLLELGVQQLHLNDIGGSNGKFWREVQDQGGMQRIEGWTLEDNFERLQNSRHPRHKGIFHYNLEHEMMVDSRSEPNADVAMVMVRRKD